VTSSFFSSVEGLSWSRDGKEVWFTASPSGAARAIYALDMSGKERIVLRVPGTLTLQDVTREGRVLVTEDNALVGIMALPPGEKVEKNLSWFDWSLLNDVSPDGKTLLFSETGEATNGRYGVFLRNVDGSPAIRLGDGTFPALSPDGKWVVATDNGSPAQVELLPTGSGQARRLTNDGLQHLRAGWMPDGSGVVFTAVEANKPVRVYWMDLNGKSRAITPEGIRGVLVTPDSKYLLGADVDGKRLLYPIQGGDPKPITAALEANDTPLQFDPDGKSLIVGQRGVPLKLFRVYLDSNRRELIRELVPADAGGVQTILGARLSADGKSYAYTYYRVLSDLWVIDGLK
jgi:dipeptidyl aminopeptidase/acylaminoacyl peptidase